MSREGIFNTLATPTTNQKLAVVETSSEDMDGAGMRPVIGLDAFLDGFGRLGQPFTSPFLLIVHLFFSGGADLLAGGFCGLTSRASAAHGNSSP